MSLKITQNDPQQRVPSWDFFVCSDHQSNPKNISTKCHEKMLNHSQEKKEPKKKTIKKWAKITENAPFTGAGETMP